MPFSTIEDRKAELVRKALEGSVFVAPMSAPTVTTLTTGAASDLTPLPAGYGDLGWLSEDGIGFGRDVTTSDIPAFGSQQPVRSDITADTTTLTCTALEIRATVLQVETGASLATLAPNVSTGEVSLAKPSRPLSPYWRVLAIAVDTDDEGREIYIARHLPRAKVTSFGDKSWTSGDQAIQTGLTFTAYVDSTLGYSDKMFFGGPGWKALNDAMGF